MSRRAGAAEDESQGFLPAVSRPACDPGGHPRGNLLPRRPPPGRAAPRRSRGVEGAGPRARPDEAAEGGDPALASARRPHGLPGARPVRSFHAKLTLLDSLRGEGALTWAGGSAKVAYEISIFLQRGEPSSTGSVDGDLRRLVARPGDGRFTLRMADGQEIAVTLSDIEDDGAALDAPGDVRAA